MIITSPTLALAHRWLAEANRREQAARELDDTQGEEITLHHETARVYRACALEMISTLKPED